MTVGVTALSDRGDLEMYTGIAEDEPFVPRSPCVTPIGTRSITR